MVALNWNRLSSLTPHSLSDDEVDEVYSMLAHYQINTQDNQQLEQLFQFAQAAMQSKAMQVDILMEDLEKEENDRKERETDLIQEIQYLKQQLGDKYQPRKKGHRDSSSSIIDRQVEALQKELKEKDRELINEKQEVEKAVSQARSLENEGIELRRNISSLHEEIAEYRHTLASTQKDEGDIDADATSIHSENAIRNKNKQVSQLLRDIQTMEAENGTLQDTLTSLKDELADATNKMDILTADYVSVNETNNQLQGVISELHEGKNEFEIQLKSMYQQREEREVHLNNITQALDLNIQQWKSSLNNKDDEIVSLRNKLSQYATHAPNVYADTEQQKMALEDTLKVREKQLEDMRIQLSEASKEIVASAAIIAQLKETRSVSHTDLTHTNKSAQHKLMSAEEDLKQVTQLLRNTEDDAKGKEEELSMVLGRLKAYESGEYGLAEAVSEIKEARMQVRIRERQVEELTSQVNVLRMQVNDADDQNAALKNRFGMPLDETLDTGIIGLRRRKQQMLIQTLERQVAQMEEEIVNLKMENHTIKQQRKYEVVQPVHPSLKEVETTRDALPKDPVPHLVDEEHQSSTEQSVKIQLADLQEENESLKKGMQEILDTLRIKDGTGDYRLECPTLEKLLLTLDTRSLSGGIHNPDLVLRVRVEALEASNAALREQLRMFRLHEISVISQLQPTVEIGEEVDNVNEQSQQHTTIATDDDADNKQADNEQLDNKQEELILPENADSTSCDVFQKLSAQLQWAMKECRSKEESRVHLLQVNQSQKEDLSRLQEKCEMLFSSHEKEQKEWEEEKRQMEERMEERKSETESLEVQLKAYKHFHVEEGIDPKPVILESVHQLALLQSREVHLNNLCRVSQSNESHVRKEMKLMEIEHTKKEEEALHKIGLIKRLKDWCLNELHSLQYCVEVSVPLETLEQANKQYIQLTAKYRDLLQRATVMQGDSWLVNELCLSLERNKEEICTLKEALVKSKQMIHVNSANIEGNVDEQVSLLSKKLATIEIESISDREKVTHLDKMNQLLRDEVSELTKRNEDLLAKLEVAGTTLSDLERRERELCEQLVGEVTTREMEELQQKLHDTQKAEASLQSEVSHLQEVCMISLSQVQMMKKDQQGRDKEMEDLRKQVADLQTKNEDKMIIGGLHRQVVSLQGQLTSATEDLYKCLSQLKKSQASTNMWELRTMEKNVEMRNSRRNGKQKIRLLCGMLHSLRSQYSGCLPIWSVEQISTKIIQLQEERKILQQKTWEAQQAINRATVCMSECKVVREGVDELSNALKGDADKKIVEWQKNMQKDQVKCLQLSCRVRILEERVVQLEESLKKREEEVVTLEEEKTRIMWDVERKQIEWEKINLLDAKEEDMLNTTFIVEGEGVDDNKPDEVPTSVPDAVDTSVPGVDPTLPIVKTISAVKPDHDEQIRKQLVESRLEVESLGKHIRDMEVELCAKQHIICNLRTQLANSMERDSTSATPQSPPDDRHVMELTEALKVAQSTMLTMQLRLHQKEESMNKYRGLLHQSREEMNKHHQSQQQENVELQSLLDVQRTTIAKLTTNIAPSSSPSNVATSCHDHMAQLNEKIEEVVVLQSALTQMDGNLTLLKKETDQLKRKILNLNTEKERLQSRHIQETNKLQELISSQEIQLQELTSKRTSDDSVINGESVRKIIDRLRCELAEKEKHQKQLTKALQDIQVQVSIQDKNSNLESKVSRLTSHIAELESELEESKSLCLESTTENEALKEKMKLVRMDIEKAKNDASKAAQQLHITRSRSVSRPRATPAELLTLQDKVRDLEKQLQGDKRSKEDTEKEQNEQVEKKIKTAEKLSRWDEKKRWQQKMDEWDRCVKKKDSEIEKLSKQVEMYNIRVTRLEKEKITLENRTKNTTGNYTSNMIHTDELEILQKENYKLKGELSTHCEMDKLIEEIKLKSNYLEDKIDSQEKQIELFKGNNRGDLTVHKKVMEVYNELDAQQRQLLSIREEKRDLIMQVQKLRIDVPRYQDRIKHLERYVEILKDEMNNMSKSTKGKIPDAKSSLAAKNNASEIRALNEKQRNENLLHTQKITNYIKKVKSLEDCVDGLTAENSNYRSKITALEDFLKEAKSDAKRFKQRAEHAEKKYKEMLGLGSGDDWKTETENLQKELERKSELLSKVKSMLTEAARKEKENLITIDQLKEKIARRG